MESSNEDYEKNMKRVQEVIRELKIAFKSLDESQDSKMQAIKEKNAAGLFKLSEELEKLEERKDPKTVIAIVGATGEGKTSLINALLDHRNVLPTSGMQACTAAVVEVVENKDSNLFEADIEFTSKEEWLKERECLIKDLTNSDGTLRKNPPDSNSDLYASYLKVKAVYGRVEKAETESEITEWLGSHMTVSSADGSTWLRSTRS